MNSNNTLSNRILLWKCQVKPGQAIELIGQQLDPAQVSLNALSLAIPGGVYTTFRTYSGHRILSLDSHIQRLEDSARLVDSPIYIDHAQLIRALSLARQQAARQLLPPDSQQADLRFRLTVDLQIEPGTVYIAAEVLETPPAEAYSQGVRVVTFPLHRSNPGAKDTSFISVAETVRQELPPDANEGLMIGEDGCILEGLSSNFFAVSDGVVRTAGARVLPGITRSFVLELCARLGLPVELSCTPLSMAPDLAEAFITSSSRSILPIRQIDQVPVPAPGPLTLAIMRAYEADIERRLEPI